MKYTNVAIYLRKSREDIENKEETLARHERILNDYCKANNLLATNIYREVVSGESIENRPVMQQLLEDVRDFMYEGVVVVELERLSRGNPVDQAEILEVFKSTGTKIYTINKVYDLASDNEFDEEFFEFGLFMSRREYKMIRRRLLRGKKQAQKEGYFIANTNPYGYDKERQGKGYVLVPNDKADIVRMIFNKFVHQGESVSDIKNYLNNNGIKPLKAKYWTPHNIKHLLRNKNYIGLIAYDTKTNTPKYYQGKHDPIIDVDTFNAADAKLKINADKAKFGTVVRNPLASIIKCSECGHTLSMATYSHGRYLRCLFPKCITKGAYLYDIEKQIISELHAELDNFNYFLENHIEEINSKQNIIQAEIISINKEIIKKDSMINKCCELLEEGIYTKEKYLERVNSLSAEITSLKSNLDLLQNTNFEDVCKAEKAIPKLSAVLDKYWSLDDSDKNKLLKSIISRIDYSKTKRKKRAGEIDNSFSLVIHLKI